MMNRPSLLPPATSPATPLLTPNASSTVAVLAQVTQQVLASLFNASTNASTAVVMQLRTTAVAATFAVYSPTALQTAIASPVVNTTVPFLPPLTLPGNAASVTIGIPIASLNTSAAGGGGRGGGSLALFAAVVAYNASLFGGVGAALPSGAGVNSSSTGRPGTALSSPSLVSDVVSVRIVITHNASQDGTVAVLPVFTATLTTIDTSTGAGTFPTSGGGLRHNCSLHRVEHVSFVCRAARITLNLTCNGLGAAIIRQDCPVPKTSCSVVNLRTGRIVDSDYCVLQPATTSTGSSSNSNGGRGTNRSQTVLTTTVCTCGGSGTSLNATSARQLLDALGGTVSVAAFSSYVSGQLDATFKASASFDAVGEQSRMVLVIFCSLWIVSLGLCAASYRGTVADAVAIAHHRRPTTEPEVEGHAHDDDVCREVAAWLDVSWLRRVTRALWRRHSLLRLVRRVWFTATATHAATSTVVPTVVTSTVTVTSAAPATDVLGHEAFLLALLTWLTSFTVTCFLLAFLYDWQYPADDSACRIYTTQAACVTGTVLFDPATPKCRWVDAPGGGALSLVAGQLSQWRGSTRLVQTPIASSNGIAAYCTLNDTEQSVRAFVVAFLLGGLASELVSRLLERCSDILLATWTTTSTPVASTIAVVDEDDALPLLRPVPTAVVIALKEALIQRCGDRYGVCFEVLLQLTRGDIASDDDEDDDDDASKRASHWWRRWGQPLMAASVFGVFQVGALYFIFTKAALRSYAWQLSLFSITMLEEVTDAVLIETLQVVVVHVGLTGLLREPLRRVGFASIVMATSKVKQASPGDGEVENGVDGADGADGDKSLTVRPATPVTMPTTKASSVLRRVPLVRWSTTTHRSVDDWLVWLVSRSYPSAIEAALYLLCLLSVALLVYVYSAVIAISLVRQAVFFGGVSVVAMAIAGRYAWWTWHRPRRRRRGRRNRAVMPEDVIARPTAAPTANAVDTKAAGALKAKDTATDASRSRSASWSWSASLPQSQSQQSSAWTLNSDSARSWSSDWTRSNRLIDRDGHTDTDGEKMSLSDWSITFDEEGNDDGDNDEVEVSLSDWDIAFDENDDEQVDWVVTLPSDDVDVDGDVDRDIDFVRPPWSLSSSL